MLYVVVKTSDNSADSDVEATVRSISAKQGSKVTSIVWQTSHGSQTSTASLAQMLDDHEVAGSDYVMVVRPGVLLSKKLLMDLTSIKWSGRNSRIRLIDHDNEPHWIGITPIAIKYELLKELDFQLGEFMQDDRCRYFLEALRHEGWYDVIEADIDLTHYDRIKELDVESPAIYDKSQYLNLHHAWNELFLRLKVAPRMAQLAYLYMLQYQLLNNVNNHNKYVLRGRVLDAFYAEVSKNLVYINDEVLIGAPTSYIKLDKNVRLFLLKLKYAVEKITYEYTSSNITRYMNSVRIDSAVSQNVLIESMEYSDGKLIIGGHSQFIYDTKKVQFICRCGDAIYELNDTKRSPGYSLFGRTIFRYPTFSLEIPAETIRSANQLSFHFIASDCKTDVRANVIFGQAMAKLNGHPYSYWACRELGRIFKYRGKILWIAPLTPSRRVHHELRYLWNLLVRGNEVMRRAAWLRIAYYLSKPIYRRPIWIFSDKPYKAGDNGEYAWDYARKMPDGIAKHYALNPNCSDANRFKQEGKPYLPFGSLRHKLAFLNADIVFATHENQVAHNSLRYEAIYLRDKFNYATLFIQHGLTVQKLSRFLNVFNDNVKKYFVASHFEAENLLRPEYGYNETHIVTSGVARYDGLKSNAKRQILIAPSWRNYLAKPGEGKGEARRKNGQFKESKYFQIYNSLINDQQLLSVAERTGYKIVFLLHPITSSQIDDFEAHDERISVVASTNGVSYEEMLTESDLMVTDYSGIQFDFAYMNKPIIYYQPKELPPTYDEAVYTYKNDSLGEMTETHAQLISKVCEYMENGCQVPSKYKKRMDSFFYHHDHNNAKRIYEAAVKVQNTLR